MAELPSGTVTFLFTDLEVSTCLWDQEPEAMSEALARHDLILRAAVEAQDGVVVKGRGDGFHAVFATEDAAVRAAVRVRALDERGVLAGERAVADAHRDPYRGVGNCVTTTTSVRP